MYIGGWGLLSGVFIVVVVVVAVVATFSVTF